MNDILRSRSKSVNNKLVKEKCVTAKCVRKIVLKEAVALKSEREPGTCHGSWMPLSITASTHHKHVKLLELVRGKTPLEIVACLRLERKTRKWKWATLRTKIGNLLGANTMSGQSAFAVLDPVIRDFRKYVDNMTLQEMPKFPRALTVKHAMEIIAILHDQKRYREMAVFSLWWSLAARLSDVFLIHTQRLHITGTTIQVTFVQGKGVKARGEPYTITVVNPFAQELQKMKDAAGTAKYLISGQDAMTRVFKSLLKGMDTAYELRSPRRGSLQHMAAGGTPLAVLRSISGHRTEAMLLRYLDWGRFAAVVAREQMSASGFLWPLLSRP